MSGFDGLHLMANLHGCAGAGELLREVNTLREHCLSKVEEAGLSTVGECFHQFGGEGGVTGVVVLAEMRTFAPLDLDALAKALLGALDAR